MLRRRNEVDDEETLIEVQSDQCPIPHCTVEGFCGTQEECDEIMLEKKNTDDGSWILWFLGLGLIAGIIFGLYKGCQRCRAWCAKRRKMKRELQERNERNNEKK